MTDAAPAAGPAVAGRSLWRDAWFRLTANKAAVVSAVYLGLMILACGLGPLVTGHELSTVYADYVRVPPSLAALAKRARLSPSHFHRVFKAITGVTPRAYAAAHRSKRVRHELNQRSKTVTEAIYDSGYAAPSRFYADAKERLGMTPSAWRDGGISQSSIVRPPNVRERIQKIPRHTSPPGCRRIDGARSTKHQVLRKVGPD